MMFLDAVYVAFMMSLASFCRQYDREIIRIVGAEWLAYSISSVSLILE